MRTWLKGLGGMQLLFAFVAVLCFVAIGLGVRNYPAEDADKVWIEIIKSGLQILTVIILGQGIAYAMKEREYSRQAIVARELVLSDWLKRLIVIYTQVKKHRRLIRARSMTRINGPGTFDPQAMIPKKVYGRHMAALNDIELDLESLWQEIRATQVKVFGGDPQLDGRLGSMKDYLRGVLGQFEKRWAVFGSQEEAALEVIDEGFPNRKGAGWLGDYLADTHLHDDSDRRSEFHRWFITPFRDAVARIRDAMLQPARVDSDAKGVLKPDPERAR